MLVAVVRALVLLLVLVLPGPRSARQLGPQFADTFSVLDHERLDVYRLALEFCALALRIAGQLPRGHAQLADQLRRAATSIPLNIAEGVGKVGAGDRAHCHRIARGEAMESGAALDIIRLLGVAPAEELDAGKSLLVRIVSMLTRMTR